MPALRTTIDITADPDAIWPHIADPVLMSVWNTRIVAVEREEEGELQEGDRLDMMYLMSDEKRRSEVEVVRCDRPREFVLNHWLMEADRPGMVAETYLLEDRGGTTRVTQLVNLGQSGIPILVRGAIWFFSRMGRPVGDGPLQRLKRSVEEIGLDPDE